MYVARFTCSVERRFIPTALSTSATVESRWRSTKCRLRSSAGVNHRGVTEGRPSPAAAPTIRSQSGPSPSGRKQARVSSYRRPPSMPRHSWTAGFQPPATRSRSASKEWVAPSGPGACRALTRGSPSVPVTDHPERTSMPRPLVSSVAGPPSPASIRARTSSPASASSNAARWPVWLVVNTTARVPGSTPNRSAYSAAAEASITPGRSSSANATGRSWAPVAKITRPARTCHTRSTGRDRS